MIEKKYNYANGDEIIFRIHKKNIQVFVTVDGTGNEWTIPKEELGVR